MVALSQEISFHEDVLSMKIRSNGSDVHQRSFRLRAILEITLRFVSLNPEESYLPREKPAKSNTMTAYSNPSLQITPTDL